MDLRLPLLMLIYDRGRLGRSEAATALRVSVRTISRCTDTLQALGAPVVGRKGPAGGWDIEAGYRARLSGFDRAMVEARLDYGLASDTGRAGFEAAVASPPPPGLRAPAPARPQGSPPPKLIIDPGGWSGGEGPGQALALLEQAIEERRTVTFAAGGRRWRLDPFALAWKAREFYLLGRSDGSDHVVAVLNIGELALLDERFEPPKGASPAALWASASGPSGAAARTVRVALRVHMQAAPELTRRHSPGRPPTIPALREALMAPNRPGPDGWYTAAFDVDDLDYLLLALWPVVGDVEATAPRELARRLSQYAARQKEGR